MNLKISDTIYKYKLIKKLGSGGFSEVWLSSDETVNKNVALKVIFSPLAEVVENLEEAKIGSSFKHKNLIKVFGADIAEDNEGNGITLIAQEYQEKGTVENLLNDHFFLPLPNLIKVLKDILLGLEYLHNKGVFHNDIKPKNILISSDGSGVLSDFGISGVSVDGNPVNPKSSYLIHVAPETLSEDKTISKLTDIYQVGCTAYRLANNINELSDAFFEKRDDILESKKIGTFKFARHKEYVPKKLAKIINKATDTDPSKRYSSAIEMRRALEKLHFSGYWTTDSTNKEELIGVGEKYKYRFKISPKPNNTYDFDATKISNKNRVTKIAKFCKKNISITEKNKLKEKYFDWVINNAS